MDTNVKFIRALWGDYKSFINEIPIKPMFNEIVYVWGIDNLKYLNGLGYETKLVSVNPLIHKEELLKFNHKVDCFEIASNDFEKFIFLDWDVSLVKEIDDSFYSKLKDSPFSAPLYSYPKNFLNLSNKLDNNRANLWVNEQIIHMKKYAWELDDLIVFPNAGFFYCSDKNVPIKMKNIIKKHNMLTVTDEFPLYMLANCDLDSYIKKYEPSQMFGKPEEDIFILDYIVDECAKKLNNYISGIIEKDIYFKHN